MNAEAFALALRALETCEPPAAAPECRLVVAGLHLRLCFATPRLAAVSTRALAHHVVDAATAVRPDQTIFVLDRDAPIHPLRDRTGTVNGSDGSAVDRIERWSYEGPAGRGLLHEGFRALYLWHRALGRAAVRMDDTGAWPYYQVALPLLPILSWLLADRGYAIVHAAAIDTGAGALLFGGRSGTGKSTTALACLDAGLGYLGDDLCVVEPGTPPRVHSLYCSGKLDPADTSRFPALAPALVSAPGADWPKSVYLFDRHHAERVVRSAPLLGVAIPRRGPAGPPVRLSASQAFLAMAPNTMVLLPGAVRAAAAGVRELVTRVPVHSVDVGSTIEDIPLRVREHADRLDSRAGRGMSPMGPPEGAPAAERAAPSAIP